KLDRRLERVSYSLAAILAIPADSHRGRASACHCRRCPPASGQSPPVATTLAYGHAPGPPARWRSDNHRATEHIHAGFYIFPFIPQPGHGQRRAVTRRVIVRLLAGGRTEPLIIAGSRNQAAVAPERITKHWPHRQCVGPRVEGGWDFLGGLLPP